MFFLFHRQNVTYVLKINVVMITTSLHFCSLHKLGGGRCRRSRNQTQKIRWHLDVQEKDAGVNEVFVVNEENTTNMDDEMTKVRESSKSMTFWQKLRGCEPHHLPLKYRQKNKTVPYIDLFRPAHFHQERTMIYLEEWQNKIRYDRQNVACLNWTRSQLTILYYNKTIWMD